LSRLSTELFETVFPSYFDKDVSMAEDLAKLYNELNVIWKLV